jgi:ferredoxin
MLRIEVNRDACQGFANCVLHAEDLFELDEAGLVVVKQPLLPADRVEDARMAEYECPTEAISIVEDPGAAGG